MKTLKTSTNSDDRAEGVYAEVPSDDHERGHWEEVTLIGPKDQLVELFTILREHAEGFASPTDSIEVLLPKAGLAPWGIVVAQNDSDDDGEVMILYNSGRNGQSNQIRIADLERALAPFADFADRLDGGPPAGGSPLYAVLDECREARRVLRGE